MQVRKVVREGAVNVVALPEIGQFRRVLVGIERSGVTPFIDLRADQIGAREVAHDLGLEQAPQEGEVEDRGAIRFG